MSSVKRNDATAEIWNVVGCYAKLIGKVTGLSGKRNDSI
jgi:hypothetical protein